MIRTTFLVVLVSLPAFAAEPKMRGWKPSLERLDRCVNRLEPEMRVHLKQVLTELNTGLSGGFLKQRSPRPPMPPSYIDSLDRDAELCEFALARNSRADFAALHSDLTDKVNDCREHGWYRNIRVQVRTLKDGTPSPGWEIYYVWIPGRNLPSLQKVRFKTLSPSEELLPPGLYSFQARKKDQASSETRVAVVSRDAVVCEIAVP